MKQILGFTLIEMLVVLAVIAILSMLAIPNKSGVVVRTQVNESIKLIEDYKTMVNLIYKTTGSFPATNSDAGVPEPDKIKGNYVSQVDLVNGSFNIVFGAKIRSELEGKVISIRPIYVEGSPTSPVSWICGNDAIPNGMLAAGDNHTDLPSHYLPIKCR
jgi:type IV pilus assembly protein PilA